MTYQLGKQYRTFYAEVSVNDGPHRTPPMIFRVHVDDKLRWESKPVSSQADLQECQVSVWQAAKS